MPEENDLLKYHIRHTDKRFDVLEEKVDRLISFRWILVGVSLGVSGVVSMAFQIFQYIGKK